MASFNGQLNTNFVFNALYNQIISMQVFPTGISDLSGIYASRKVDGTLYGDTKLYVSTDALKSYAWDGSDTGYNLLTIHQPPMPAEKKIQMGVYRQIPLTITNYLVKQASKDEGSFSTFTGVLLSWMSKTKEVYEHTKFTTDIVTKSQASAKGLGVIDLTNTDFTDAFDMYKWRGQELFRQLEDYVEELKEPSRNYNDLAFLRNYTLEDFDIVVPLGVLSSVTKHDVPYLFNPDSKISVKEIHWKYFGTKNTTAGTTTASNNNIRSYIEKDYGTAPNIVHVFPGDLIPNSTAYLANETYTATFTTRPDIGTNNVPILLVHKQDFPIMSAFVVQTSFFNARRLDMNNYLTFGHNDVEQAHIEEYALLKLTTKTQ